MLTQIESSTAIAVDSGDDLIVSMPILVLNIHSRCNCRCVMCDIWQREDTSELRVADLEPHRETFRKLGVKWVILSGGEPLLHSDLPGLCAFLCSLGVRLTLLTTGLLLSKRADEVARWFDDIIVSLDGPAAIHDRIRRINGAFELITNGIAAVRRLQPNLKITARTTVQKANHCSLRETVASTKAIGLDGISFLAADLTSEAFNRELPWSAERQNTIALTPSEIVALENEIESLIASCAEDIRTGYVAEGPSKLRKIARHFRAHLGIGAHEAPMCNAPWVSAVVEADGAVRPCFFHRPIGNLGDSRFDSIINSNRGRGFRAALNTPDDPTCRRCVCSLNYSKRGDAHP